MSLPLLKYRQQRIEARRQLTSNERLIEGQKDLRFWTDVGLGIAVALGLVVVACHGGVRTAGIAAFGASLGTGGILGFLFGVPSTSRTPVTINNARTVAVGVGNDSKTTGGAVGNPAEDLSPSAGSPQPGSPAQALSANANASAGDTSTSGADVATDTTVVPHNTTSNLEQVADWVTKLLLGGGLTQMQHIPPKIWQWSRVVALGILGNDPQVLGGGNPAVSERLILAQQSYAAALLVYGFALGFFSGFLITKLQFGKAISE
jgi:hypothetical protein